MRPNNRQRSRGGRSGGGHQHHNKQHHSHNANRPPNRNQIFDSSGPDVRVRGNAHQVFDKYQALAREAAASGDRIMAEAYWQYADHYYRVIQSMGGFSHRNNQGWGEGGEEGQPTGQPQQPGQPNGPQQNGGANDYAAEEPYPQSGRAGGREERSESREPVDEPADSEPGLGGVAFLQGSRQGGAPDPAADEQPDVPEFAPAGAGRRN